MVSLATERAATPWYQRLFLPAYQVKDAARYAGASPRTVATWHYGGNPALPGRERKQPLSYMELVEIAFVSHFRKAGVSLNQIRKAREYVASNFETAHPFTEYRFKTEGHHILMDYFKIDTNRESRKIIVAEATGQLTWTNLMEDRFAEFDYELDLALTWHPAGRDSAVKIDPRIAFGEPIADGIPTFVIKGRWTAGESIEEIAADFGISPEVIKDALRFEQVEIGGTGNGR